MARLFFEDAGLAENFAELGFDLVAVRLSAGAHDVDDNGLSGRQIGEDMAKGFTHEAAAAVALNRFAGFARDGDAQAGGRFRIGGVCPGGGHDKDMNQGPAPAGAIVIDLLKFGPLKDTVMPAKKKAALGRFFFKLCHGIINSGGLCRG